MSAHLDSLFSNLTRESKAWIVQLRTTVEPILENNLLPHFTDHSVKHSDRLVELVNHLIKPIQSTEKKLSEEELKAVYASCYLHDFGMHFENIGQTRTFRTAFENQNWEELAPETQQSFLRDKHHLLVEDLILESIDVPRPPIGVAFSASDNPRVIASICACHALDTQEKEFTDRIPEESPLLRIRLLAGILRVADILDESRRRALTGKRESLNLNSESLQHWWRHHYVKDITFVIEKRSIKVILEFPPDHTKRYSDLFIPLIVHKIEDELAKHKSPFFEAGIAWTAVPEVFPPHLSSSQEMPESILQELEHQSFNEPHLPIHTIPQGRRQTDELQRIAQDLRDLDEGEKLPSGEDLRIRISIADRFFREQAYRSTWACLYFSLKRNAAVLPEQERVRIIVWLGRIVLDDGFPRMALDLLETVRGIIDTDCATAEIRFQFWLAYGESLLLLGDMKTGLEALTSAKETAFAETSKVQSIIDATNFLMGSLDKVISFQDLKVSPKKPVSELEDPRFVELRTRALCLSMRGNLGEAIDYVAIFRGNEEDTQQPTVAHEVILAELEYLSGSFQSSFERYTERIVPLLSLPLNDENIRKTYFALAANRVSIASKAFDHTTVSEHYLQYDLRRLYNILLTDDRSFLSAIEQMEEGKDFESLPKILSEYIAAYRSLNWQAFQKSAEWMARQYSSLNQLEDAAYFAVLSMDERTLKQVSEEVLAKNDATTVEGIVDRLLSDGHLLLHGIAASQLLKDLCDLVPDHQIDPLIQWVVSHVEKLSVTICHLSFFESLCDLLSRLGFRSSEECAHSSMISITAHQGWSAKNVARRRLVNSIHSFVPRLSSDDLRILAKSTIPLVTTEKEDIDYVETLNLTCSIAKRCDSETLAQLQGALFPSESQVTNSYLVQVAGLFNPDVLRNPINVESINKNALETARRIRLQVQRIPKEGKEENPGNSPTLSIPRGNEKIVVLLPIGPDLQTLIKYKDLLYESTVSKVVGAILESVSNPLNVLSNRSHLIDALSEIIHKLTLAQQDEAIARILPLVNGFIEIAQEVDTEGEFGDKLNPFKWNTGKRSDVQCIALLAASNFASAFPEHPKTPEVCDIIGKCLLSGEPHIRQFALRAVNIVGIKDAFTITAVLVSTRDTDAKVACSAFYTLATIQWSSMTEDQKDLTVFSVQIATASEKQQVRVGAAHFLQRVRDQLGEDPRKERIEETIRRITSDPCFSVRSRITNPELWKDS